MGTQSRNCLPHISVLLPGCMPMLQALKTLSACLHRSYTQPLLHFVFLCVWVFCLYVCLRTTCMHDARGSPLSPMTNIPSLYPLFPSPSSSTSCLSLLSLPFVSLRYRAPEAILFLTAKMRGLLQDHRWLLMADVPPERLSHHGLWLMAAAFLEHPEQFRNMLATWRVSCPQQLCSYY